MPNKSINYAPSAPDSLHCASLRSSCRLLRRYVANKMKVFLYLLIFLSVNTYAERPIICSENEIEVISVAKIVDFTCDDDGCGVLVKAPKEHKETPWIGYTLTVGKSPNYD